MMKALITGVKSGLGRYLHERIGRDGLHRETVIVHCAWRVPQKVGDSNWHNNISLAYRLRELPHKKFIFISSVDVYRDTVNGQCKLNCEHLLAGYTNDLAVIRPTSLIGKYQRPNAITKVRDGAKSVTLSGKSKFYYVWNEEILFLIKKVISTNFVGRVDIGMEDGLVLEDLAEGFNKNVEFGNFLYELQNEMG